MRGRSLQKYFQIWVRPSSCPTLRPPDHPAPRNGAVKALYWTGNQSALAASNWIFDQVSSLAVVGGSLAMVGLSWVAVNMLMVVAD